MMTALFARTLFVLFFAILALPRGASAQVDPPGPQEVILRMGDILRISVWPDSTLVLCCESL